MVDITAESIEMQQSEEHVDIKTEEKDDAEKSNRLVIGRVRHFFFWANKLANTQSSNCWHCVMVDTICLDHP